MKKILLFSLVGIIALGSSVFANEKEDIYINDSSDPYFLSEVGISLYKPEHLKYSGFVKNVIKDNENIINSIIVETNNPNELIPDNVMFSINKDLIIMSDDNMKLREFSNIKEGMSIDVFYSSKIEFDLKEANNANPFAIVIKNLDNQDILTLTKFDDELISYGKTIKLIINDKTFITNQEGEIFSKERLVDKDLIVFYEKPTTIKIPRETLAKRIIVITDESPKIDIYNTGFSIYHLKIQNQVIHLKNIIYSDGDNNMIPVREVFEKLGYVVTWDNKENAIEIKKLDNLTYLPQKNITINDGVSYVSHKFLTDFMKLSVDFNI